MTRYGEMTNYEINKAVADILKLNTIAHDRTEIVLFDDMDATPFDPCNNPADAMPIIIENGISSLFNGDEWICSALNGEFLSINESLYRAGCEVYLLMKEAENETSSGNGNTGIN